MPEPITLAVLGTIAATEGIKFLFGQASDLIKAYRERRKAAEAGEELPATLDVPLQSPPVLDQAPAQTPADTQVVADHDPELADLVRDLSSYATGIDEVSVDDATLAEKAGRLRQLLEAAYGQRLTFKGENRQPTGTRVTVTQVLVDVDGKVTGIRTISGDADAQVRQEAKRVGPGGEMTGVDEVRGG